MFFKLIKFLVEYKFSTLEIIKLSFLYFFNDYEIKSKYKLNTYNNCIINNFEKSFWYIVIIFSSGMASLLLNIISNSVFVQNDSFNIILNICSFLLFITLFIVQKSSMIDNKILNVNGHHKFLYKIYFENIYNYKYKHNLEFLNKYFDLIINNKEHKKLLTYYYTDSMNINHNECSKLINLINFISFIVYVHKKNPYHILKKEDNDLNEYIYSFKKA